MSQVTAATDPGGILRKHFEEWCARFKIFPSDSGFFSESGRSVHPVHAIIESDNSVWLSGLGSFELSGIRGHVEDNRDFRFMLAKASESPTREPDGMTLVINGRRYQTIFQNTGDAGANHIINVAFILADTHPCQGRR